jgi:hypothetical protein
MYRLLRIAIVLVVAGSIVAGTAKAEPVRASCLTMQPRTSPHFGANTPSVQAVSTGGSYATYPCYRFLTDVVVPTNASGGPDFYDKFRLGFGYADVPTGSTWGGLPLSQSDCAGLGGDFYVFKRTVLQTDFGLVGGGSVHGSWSTNGCFVAYGADWDALPKTYNPPDWLSTTYRLVVGLRVGSTWKQVKTTAAFVPILP